MKVGDLVELSAYGRSLTCNYEFKGHVGLVIETDGSVLGLADSGASAVMVSWSGREDATFDKPAYHIRRDLKHIR